MVTTQEPRRRDAHRTRQRLIEVAGRHFAEHGYDGTSVHAVAREAGVAANLITRQTLGWEPTQPALMADLDNGHYFAAS